MQRFIDVKSASFKGNRRKKENGTQAASTPETLVKKEGAKSDSPIPNGSSSERVIASAVAGEYRYAMLGIVLGALAILGGVLLGLHGVAGHTSWTAKFLGLSSQINDAAPGVVLFIVGLFMIVATRPRVRLGDLKDSD